MNTRTKTSATPSNPYLSWFTRRGEPLHPVSLAFFLTVPLAPAIFALLSSPLAGAGRLHSSVPFAWSVVGISPVVCGFWIAARYNERCFAFAITGIVVSLLLLAVNWIIMAEGCCATSR